MFWKRFRRDRAAVIGLILVTLIVAISIIGPSISSCDPTEQSLAKRRQSPNKENIFGRDAYGRDILSRILYGGRVTIVSGLSVVVTSVIVGIFLGSLSGYFGGLTELIIMRVVDFMLAFPTFFLAILIVSMLGTNLRNAIIAAAITTIPQYARIVRSSTLSLKNNTYIEAAKAMGASNLKIIFDHIIPNLIGPIIVLATTGLGSAIILVSGLSFLGMGAQPPTAEWGLMLSEARAYVTSNPHMTIIPGIFLVMLVLSCNLVGDGLRDVLDPRLK